VPIEIKKKATPVKVKSQKVVKEVVQNINKKRKRDEFEGSSELENKEEAHKSEDEEIKEEPKMIVDE
jgi:hypothetical protein